MRKLPGGSWGRVSILLVALATGTVEEGSAVGSAVGAGVGVIVGSGSGQLVLSQVLQGRVMSLRAVGAFAAASGLALGTWAHIARRWRAAEHTQSNSESPLTPTAHTKARGRRRLLAIVAGAGIGALVGASIGTGIVMYSHEMQIDEVWLFVQDFSRRGGLPPAKPGLFGFLEELPYIMLLCGAAFGAAIGMATGAAVGAGLHFAHVLAVGTAAAAALGALTWVALSQNFEPGRAESGAKHAKRH